MFCALREKFGRHRTASGQYRTGMAGSRIARPLSATPQFLSCRTHRRIAAGRWCLHDACGTPADGPTSRPPVQRHFFDPCDRPRSGREAHASGAPSQDGNGEWPGIDERTCMIAEQRHGDAHRVASVRRGGTGACWSHCRPTCQPVVPVGSCAQEYYLPEDAGMTLSECVRDVRRVTPMILPTPHLSRAERGAAKAECRVGGRVAARFAPRDSCPVYAGVA